MESKKYTVVFITAIICILVPSGLSWFLSTILVISYLGILFPLLITLLYYFIPAGWKFPAFVPVSLICLCSLIFSILIIFR